MKKENEFNKIVEKMSKKFCSFCKHLDQYPTNGEDTDGECKNCSFANICTKSLYILKKETPLYFEPIK